MKYNTKKFPTPKSEFQIPTTRKAVFLFSNLDLNQSLTDLLYEVDTWLFDLDGTLIDSHSQISESLLRTLSEHGLQQTNIHVLKSYIGLSLDQILNELEIPFHLRGSIKNNFRRELRGKIEENEPTLFDGSTEILQILRLAGKKIAIATNKPTDLARLVVMRSNLSSYIDVVVGSTELNPKPHPDIILKCSSLLESRKLVMIGDREEDFLAAKAAEIAFIGVSPQLKVTTELKCAQTLLFKSMRVLADSIRRINLTS
jgi:phosphoglycolate phosphatase